VFIEMLFFVPVVVLIWILLSFVHQAKRTAVVTQRDARECMWEYATNGCRGGLSSACQSAGAGIVPDFALRATSDFESVAGDVPITAPNVVMLHGRYAGVSTERDVRRPSVLGGNTTATGRMSVMCGEDPIVKWVTEPIYQVICNQHGKAEWCN
jgi:hypothetical protein